MKNSTSFKIFIFLFLANFTTMYFPLTTIIVVVCFPLFLQLYFYWKQGVCYICGDNVIKGKSAHWYLGFLFVFGVVNTAMATYMYLTR